MNIRIAIISDIHGNAWALKAILKDVSNWGTDSILNLGDTLYGPLDPVGTFNLLQQYGVVSIAGNEDRMILEALNGKLSGDTLEYVLDNLDINHIRWLESLQGIHNHDHDILMFHGTPYSDKEYMLEEIVNGMVVMRPNNKLESLLKGFEQKIVLCGHSHIPGIAKTGTRIIINPGSVGCPAFTDDYPQLHKMENGTPNASYCRLVINDLKVTAEHMKIEYDYMAAAIVAERNKRPDWALWLLTGMTERSA
jgi:putative phosphoesterase